MAVLLRRIRAPRVLHRGRHAQRRVRRLPGGPLGLALAAIGAALVIGPVAIAGSTDRPGHGLLSVITEPSVESGISVGGTLRNTGAIQGLELPAGDHEVCFSPVEGYLAPECMVVNLEDGVHTTATGTFLPAGTVVIVAEPTGLEPTVTVDGVERDRGDTTLVLAEGEHEICWSEESGYTTPDCQAVVVEASQTMTLVGTYEEIATAPSDPEPSPDEEASEPTDSPTAENLLTDPQHTFNAAEVGWVAQGNTIISQTDSASFDEAGALAVSVSDSGPWPDDTRTARVGSSPGKHDGVPVQANTDYSGFARVLSLDGAADARCELRWYSAAGKQRIIRTDPGPMSAVAEREWTTVQCRAVAPADAVAGSLRVLFDGVDYGRSFLVDDAWLVQGALDGSSPPAEPTEEPTSEPIPEPTETQAPAPSPEPTETQAPTSEPTEDPSPEPTQDPTPEPTLEPSTPAPAPSSWQDAWDSWNASTMLAWYDQNAGIAAAGLSDADLKETGTITTSRDGQVIEGMLVRGAINVVHDGVVIRNTKVVSDGSYYAISVPFGDRSRVNALEVENVSIEGFGCASGSDPKCETAIMTWPGNRLTATRVHIRGHSGGIRLHSGARISYSYVGDIQTYSGSHNTAMSTRGGSDYELTRNYLTGSTSSALSLYSDSVISDFRASQNMFDGGTYSVRAGHNKAAGDQINNVKFTDNRFTKNYTYGPRATWCDSCPGNVWTGNVHVEDRSPAP